MKELTEPEDIEGIREALRDGEKILAIKIYREVTGCGLKEAKEYVDRLSAELIEQYPDQYAKLAKGSGCASVLLIGASITLATIAWSIHHLA